MRRRTINLREARAEFDAAEARGLAQPTTPKAPRAAPQEAKPKPKNQPRQKVVWAVCDLGGRTVATFAYPEKAQAEALVAQLKERGKGQHFVRSVKEPM